MLTSKHYALNKILNLRKINIYFILFVFFPFFNYYVISGSSSGNPDQIQDQVGLEGPGNKINENQEPIEEQYGIFSCIYNPNIKNKDCFNNIIIFNQKKYQVNNFAKNKNGDILIQYNEYNNYDELNSSRIFYGLTKDGGYFFSNKSSYTREFNINIDEEIWENSDFLYFYKIQDSKSLFISIKNDINKKNQYLFSINAYNSMVELYDLNNDNNKYQIWSFNKFFNLDEDDYYFPLEYKLFELKEKSEYFIAFIPLLPIDENILDVSFIKRFRFKSFDSNAYEELSSINYEDYLNSNIIDIFLFEESNTLVTLTINKTLTERPIIIEDPPKKLRRILSKEEKYPEYP